MRAGGVDGESGFLGGDGEEPDSTNTRCKIKKTRRPRWLICFDCQLCFVSVAPSLAPSIYISMSFFFFVPPSPSTKLYTCSPYLNVLEKSLFMRITMATHEICPNVPGGGRGGGSRDGLVSPFPLLLGSLVRVP